MGRTDTTFLLSLGLESTQITSGDSKKRRRADSEPALTAASPTLPDRKRAKNSLSEQGIRQATTEDNAVTGEAMMLTSRFGVHEFNRTRAWLDRLEDVIGDIANRLSTLESQAVEASSYNGRLLYAEQRPVTQSTATDDEIRLLVRKVATMWGGGCLTKDGSFLKFDFSNASAFFNNPSFQSSISLFCKIASQTCYCCAMLLTVNEGRELPAQTFDLLADASLSDL